MTLLHETELAIRALRQRLKRTLEDIATAAGISTPFLSQVERGLASPSLTSLAGIAGALGVSMRYFVDAPVDESTVCRSEEAVVLWVGTPTAL